MQIDFFELQTDAIWSEACGEEVRGRFLPLRARRLSMLGRSPGVGWRLFGPCAVWETNEAARKVTREVVTKILDFFLMGFGFFLVGKEDHRFNFLGLVAGRRLCPICVVALSAIPFRFKSRMVSSLWYYVKKWFVLLSLHDQTSP